MLIYNITLGQLKIKGNFLTCINCLYQKTTGHICNWIKKHSLKVRKEYKDIIPLIQHNITSPRLCNETKKITHMSSKVLQGRIALLFRDNMTKLSKIYFNLSIRINERIQQGCWKLVNRQNSISFLYNNVLVWVSPESRG